MKLARLYDGLGLKSDREEGQMSIMLPDWIDDGTIHRQKIMGENEV